MENKLSSGKQDTLHLWQIKTERASDEALVTMWMNSLLGIIAKLLSLAPNAIKW